MKIFSKLQTLQAAQLALYSFINYTRKDNADTRSPKTEKTFIFKRSRCKQQHVHAHTKNQQLNNFKKKINK